MNRDDIIRMASESGMVLGYPFLPEHLERFASFVAAATRESMKAEGWRACAVGQRETQHCGLLETAVLVEREACARMFDMPDYLNGEQEDWFREVAAAIRAKGK